MLYVFLIKSPNIILENLVLLQSVIKWIKKAEVRERGRAWEISGQDVVGSEATPTITIG